MELKDYWRAVRNRWVALSVCIALCVGAAVAITALLPREYEARTELYVAPEAGSSTAELMQGSNFILDRVKSYVQVIPREVVLAPVIEELDLDLSVAELAERVQAEVIAETVVIEIVVTDSSPERAAAIANAIAAEFSEVAPTLEPMRADETAVVRVTIVESAQVPLAPVSPRPTLNLALGLLLGVALGLAVAVVREALDRRIKAEADVKSLTDAPVMGHIPLEADAADRPLIVQAKDSGARAEALRRLRTNLQFLDVPVGERAFVITSSLPGEGKTVTAINLAVTLAEVQLRVCLVEADLRRPRIGEYVGLEDAVGLTDVLIDSYSLADVTQNWRPGLDVVLAGSVPPNPSDLLASARMDEVIAELSAAYDVVLIDAPPLLPVTDAALIAKRCAGALVLVGWGRKAVTRAELDGALEGLQTAGARVLGVILNKLPVKGPNAVRASTYSYASIPPRRHGTDERLHGGHGAAPARVEDGESSSERHEQTATSGDDAPPAPAPADDDDIEAGSGTSDPATATSEHDIAEPPAEASEVDTAETAHEDRAGADDPAEPTDGADGTDETDSGTLSPARRR